MLGEAINNPATKEEVIKQFSRLYDTIFRLNHVDFEEHNAFIPVKFLNAARRDMVQGLYELKLKSKKKRIKDLKVKEKISFPPKTPYLTAAVTNKEQYDACVSCGIKEIYFENVVRRNQNNYREKEGQLLIGGYGGIYHYMKTNPLVTDYSLNVVNSTSCYELYKLGVKRVTLSCELLSFALESKEQVVKTIKDALGKLNANNNKTVFNQGTDTRGTFNKEIL